MSADDRFSPPRRGGRSGHRRWRRLIALTVLLALILGALAGILLVDERPLPDNDLRIGRVAPVPPDENAFHHLKLAHEKFWESERLSVQMCEGALDDFAPSSREEELGPLDLDDVRDFLDRNRGCIALIRRAASCQVYQEPPSYAEREMSGHASSLRTLMKLLNLHICLASARGQITVVRDGALQLFECGGLISEGSEDLLCAMVARAVMTLGYEHAQALLRRTDVTAEFLQPLCDRFADAPWQPLPRDRLLFLCYRSIAHDLKEHPWMYWQPEVPEWVVPFAYKPQRTRNGVITYLRQFLLILEDGWNPEVMGEEVERLSRFQRLRSWLSGNHLGRIPLEKYRDFVILVTRRSIQDRARLAGTRLLLALRSHELDHGRLPGSLADLVPRYLDAVPLDPFDRQPMRYDRERGWVYSVGRDLIDRGGVEDRRQGKSYWNEPTYYLREPDGG